MSFSLRVALNDDIMMILLIHHLIHDDTLLIYHYYINHNHRAVYVGGESTLNAGFSTFFGNTARSAGGAVSSQFAFLFMFFCPEPVLANDASPHSPHHAAVCLIVQSVCV